MRYADIIDSSSSDIFKISIIIIIIIISTIPRNQHKSQGRRLHGRNRRIDPHLNSVHTLYYESTLCSSTASISKLRTRTRPRTDRHRTRTQPETETGVEIPEARPVGFCWWDSRPGWVRKCKAVGGGHFAVSVELIFCPWTGVRFIRFHSFFSAHAQFD